MARELGAADAGSVDRVGHIDAQGFAELANGVGAKVAFAALVLGNGGGADPSRVSKLGLRHATQGADGFEFCPGEHVGHCGSPLVYFGVR